MPWSPGALIFLHMNTTLPILSEIKVEYKMNTKGPKITDSRSAFSALYPLYEQATIGLHESIYMILLNRVNRVIGYYLLGKGGTSACHVDIKIMLSIALKTLSHSIIICHNHPSGNLQPSEADMALTRKIISACNSVDLKLLDHLIVNPEGLYLSMAETTPLF